MSQNASELPISELDLERYDFGLLRSDVLDIIDVQSAVVTTIKWSLIIPFGGTWLGWTIFGSRMPTWLLLIHTIVLAVLLILAAINIGLMFALRNRIAQTNAAADRVVTTTSMLHADLLRIRAGEIDLPMAHVARVLTQELVFPLMMGSLGSAASTAITATGPLGFLSRQLLKEPLRLIEARVLEALEEPDVPTSGGPPPTAAEVTATLLAPDLPEAFSDWYETIHRRLTQVVDGVGTVATGSLGAVLAVPVLPLVGWIAFGWHVLS